MIAKRVIHQTSNSEQPQMKKQGRKKTVQHLVGIPVEPALRVGMTTTHTANATKALTADKGAPRMDVGPQRRGIAVCLKTRCRAALVGER